VADVSGCIDDEDVPGLDVVHIKDCVGQCVGTPSF